MLTLGEGVAEAPLVGGCLTLLCSSIGTPYEVQTEGCILLVEDLNTDPYLIDTALNHLRLAGKLDGIAGFAFGTSVNLQYQTLPEGPESTLSIEEILDELIAPLGMPAISNVPFGHGKHLATMPLGGDGADRRRRQEPRDPRGGGRGAGMTNQSPTIERERWMGTRLRVMVAVAVVAAARRSCWSRSRPRRRTAAATAVTATTAAATAVRAARGRSTPPPGATPAPTADDDPSVLRLGWAQDPNTLNPFVGQDEEDYTVWAINWDLPINFSPKDLSPTPGIVESWEVSEDRKTVTMHIEPDMKWSDGKPITSADVKWSLDELGGHGILFTSYTSSITKIDTPDPETVVVHTKRPDARDHRRPLHLRAARSTSGARCRSRS